MELLKHRAKGVDVSSNNHTDGEPFDFLKVKQAGFDFIYVKATQGNNYLNPYLLGDTRRAYDAGLRVGVYHFYDETAGTPEEQAVWFIQNGIESVIHNNGDILGLFSMFDYEVGAPSAAIRDAFMERMQDSKRPCGQYMDRSFFDTIGEGGAYTWLAWPGWTPHDGTAHGVELVQYGGEAVPGIGGITDVNETLDYHKIQMPFEAEKPPLPSPPRSNAEGRNAPAIVPPVTNAVIDKRSGVERRSGGDRRLQPPQ